MKLDGLMVEPIGNFVVCYIEKIIDPAKRGE